MNGADLAVLVVPFLDGSSNRVEAGTDLEVVVVVVVVDPTPPTCCQQSPAPESCGSQQSLPQVARKGSTLSGFVQRSRLERDVGRDLHSNKWEEV